MLPVDLFKGPTGDSCHHLLSEFAFVSRRVYVQVGC
jgi:hypothetical protein